jgi:hypothetical protein
MLKYAARRFPGEGGAEPDLGYTRPVTETVERRPKDSYHLTLSGVQRLDWRTPSMPRILLLLLAVALPSTGCLAAAAAGAAGGIYVTTRGAESLVEGSVDQIAGRSEAVMGEMGIVKQGESTEDQGDKQVLKGTKDKLDVTIEIRRESPNTAKVEVTARENLAEWDKDYAKQVLSRIVEKG